MADGPDTNTLEVDINALGLDTINTGDNGLVNASGPGSGKEGSGEGKAPDGSEGKPSDGDGKAAPDVNVSPDGKPGSDPDGKVSPEDPRSPEERYKGAQAKLHEQAELIKGKDAQMKAMQDMLSRNKPDDSIKALLKQSLEAQLAAGKPKPPTQEEIQAKFNEVAADNPFEAVQLLLKHSQADQVKAVTADQVAEIVNKAVGGYKQENINSVIESNIERLFKTRNVQEQDESAGLQAFGKFLNEQFAVLGDQKVIGQAIANLGADPAKLSQAYDNFQLFTNKDKMLAQVQADAEKKAAEKMGQQPPGSFPGNDPKPKKLHEMYSGDAPSSGFDEVFGIS